MEAAAKERLETQKTSFEGYGAKQTKLLESAVLDTKGEYVLLAVSENADEMAGAFQKSL